MTDDQKSMLNIDSEERAQLDARLKEGLVAMERFTNRLLDHLGVKYDKPQDGVLKVEPDAHHDELLRKGHLLVFDPGVYPELEEQHAELLTPASPFFRRMMSLGESVGPLGLLRTRRATPYTLFHFHVHLEGMNFEWQDLVSIAVDDDGDPVPDPPAVRALIEAMEGKGDLVGRFEPVDPKDAPAAQVKVPEGTLEAAPLLLKQAIAPRLDELAAAVETGLRKTQERLHAYYEQMRDEIRRDEVKVRRRIGELNSKIWYTEDKIRLMRLEKEREVLAAELKEMKEKTSRTLDHLALEERERLAKEAERAKPEVRIRLVAATRVLPI